MVSEAESGAGLLTRCIIMSVAHQASLTLQRECTERAARVWYPLKQSSLCCRAQTLINQDCLKQGILMGQGLNSICVIQGTVNENHNYQRVMIIKDKPQVFIRQLSGLRWGFKNVRKCARANGNDVFLLYSLFFFFFCLVNRMTL